MVKITGTRILAVTTIAMIGVGAIFYFAKRIEQSRQSKVDYHSNDSGDTVINDITQMNPITVREVERPTTVDEVCDIVKNSEGAISIGGGRFSMGGQTASEDSLHIDMRQLNKIVDFSKENKTIKVQAGIRWCDIQKYIDKYNLSVKIMQTYANFTVGGSLSVNCHGRYVGLGPIILSVKSISVVLADGELVDASPDFNSEIFYGAIGGYNAIGIIVEAELELTDNVAVERVHKKMPTNKYKYFFIRNIRDNPSAVFHNGDMYPPEFKTMRSVTWHETYKMPTVSDRLVPLKQSYPIEQFAMWSVSEMPSGKWAREHIIEPLFYFRKKIHYRNYEAGNNVAELEPKSRDNSTYVLQEYFIPINNFDSFATKMAEIFNRHKVNVINVSVRHALADPGSYLAWAREEVFAFVIYYKQGTSNSDKESIKIWTRELIDAAIALNGCHYLPYQVLATPEQFRKAYPNAEKLFALKDKLDPDFRFRNALWNAYYRKIIS